MDRPVELLPLVCFKCETPLPAQPDEVAWVCGRCGQGLALDEDKGLVALDIRYAAGILPNAKGKPYWVAQGQVSVQRQTFDMGSKDREAQSMWSQPRPFFIPAYTCPLETLLNLGPGLLMKPPALQPGPAVAFEPVTLAQRDMQALAEYIIIAIEAGRSDMLKQVQVTVQLTDHMLWILP